MSTVIRCVGLHKRFGAVQAVDGIDLSQERGHFLALLGPSGCGKTTTLRLIAGLEEPDAGSLEINGAMMADGNVFVPPERRRVGMVFQDYALFPHLDIAQNVAFGLPKGSHRPERVAEMLELVGLTGLERRHPHELSGGQQQRVALARALAPMPTLVLLDEPFSNMDAALRTRVRTEVRDILARAQTTAIFVTHDQAEAFSLADTVAVMFRGKVAQVGTPEELYRHPQTKEVAMFVGDTDILPGEAKDGRVACELGTLAAATHITGRVDVLIRPEMIEVTPDDAGLPIIGREFLGPYQRLTIRLMSGLLVRAQTDGAQDIRIGQTVRLAVQGTVGVFPVATTIDAFSPAGAEATGDAAPRPHSTLPYRPMDSS